MSKLPTKQERPSGLYNKFIIQKTDGTPIDENAEFFVLRLDEQDDTDHRQACIKAVIAYAKAIKPYLPQLSNDLIERYAKHTTFNYKFWYFVHNAIAHPLLTLGFAWTDKFHNWTANKM